VCLEAPIVLLYNGGTQRLYSTWRVCSAFGRICSDTYDLHSRATLRGSQCQSERSFAVPQFMMLSRRTGAAILWRCGRGTETPADDDAVVPGETHSPNML